LRSALSGPPEIVLGVGHDEQPFPPVAGADLGRAEYSSRNAVAHSFQCRNEGCELSVCIPGDVFAEETMRPQAIDVAEHLVDEPSLVVSSFSLSGHAVGLTGVSRSDAMNDATPRLRIEGAKVSPDRCRM
jgi:hypothetical protein